jgi:glutamine synthetase
LCFLATQIFSSRAIASLSYAPTAPTWGQNNRSVAIRVPAGAPENRHLEHRAAGVDANPYLVAATVLLGMRRGLESKRDPGPPATDYPAARPDALPPDWRTAIDNAAASSFLKDALGERLHGIFLSLKQAEYRRFAAEITALEHALYADVI